MGYDQNFLLSTSLQNTLPVQGWIFLPHKRWVRRPTASSSPAMGTENPVHCPLFEEWPQEYTKKAPRRRTPRIYPHREVNPLETKSPRRRRYVKDPSKMKTRRRRRPAPSKTKTLRRRMPTFRLDLPLGFVNWRITPNRETNDFEMKWRICWGRILHSFEENVQHSAPLGDEMEKLLRKKTSLPRRSPPGERDEYFSGFQRNIFYVMGMGDIMEDD